jgi:signal peptidase I
MEENTPSTGQGPAHASLMPSSSSDDSGRGLRDLFSVVAVLACALLLAFGLISFVFQSYEVDGPSMETSLDNNDHLIVWKVPRTLARVTGHPYIPNRGDVVIFNEPGVGINGVSTGQNKQLIKRVLGLPGERVTVRDNVVTVYNKEFPEGYQPDEALPYGKVIGDTSGNIDVTLKADEVYVCGDNRGNSLDSRSFGPVQADNIVGKLAVRVLPLNKFTLF